MHGVQGRSPVGNGQAPSGFIVFRVSVALAIAVDLAACAADLPSGICPTVWVVVAVFLGAAFFAADFFTAFRTAVFFVAAFLAVVLFAVFFAVAMYCSLILIRAGGGRTYGVERENSLWRS